MEFQHDDQMRIMAAMISVGLLIIRNPPQLPVLFAKPGSKIKADHKPDLNVAKDSVDIAYQINEWVQQYSMQAK